MSGLRFLETIAGGALLSAILMAALAACENDDADGAGDTGDVATETGDAGGDLGLDLHPDSSVGDTAGDTSLGDVASDVAADAVLDLSDAGACDANFTSNLEGVRIQIDDARCIWTVAEAAAGIEIDYRLTISEDVAEVRPERQDGGGCGQPDESGLIPFERVTGGEQLYCLCDTGLCQGDPLPVVTLEAGTFDYTFEWEGRNWQGPSDFGQQPGDPFPPGVYTLSVSAIGEHGTGEEAAPFEVEGTLEITLLP